MLRHEDIARNLPYNVTGAGYVIIGSGLANKSFKVKCWSKMNEPKLICNPVKDKKAIERFLEINEVEVTGGRLITKVKHSPKGLIYGLGWDL